LSSSSFSIFFGSPTGRRRPYPRNSASVGAHDAARGRFGFHGVEPDHLIWPYSPAAVPDRPDEAAGGARLGTSFLSLLIVP
jgi:hypothetical protein